jgi:ElaB/YqjD/DUF883 family membrane-anchored ribosome-binding protein
MDQRESHIRENIEDTRTAVTEKIEMLEGRVHETMEGTKSTIDTVMDSIKRVQGTVEEAKSAVDNILETLKYTMEETIERVKSTTDLIEQVNRNPWIMFGSAIVMGYILSSIDYKRSFDSRHAHERRNNAEPERRTAESRV